jgi:hydroxyacylglutathione hydrolase
MTDLQPGQQLVGKGRSAVTVEKVADSVWLMRGGASPPLIPHRIMNVYFIEEGDGVTVFDAGVRSMAPHIQHVGQRMGGIKRIVLGHAHPDHRGAAARLPGPPVWCHADEASYAEADDGQPYTDFKQLPLFTKEGPLRLAMRIFLHHVWDAGPVRVERTLEEGDPVAGFEVVHVPGHAPGQIVLWRESDRLALTTDCFYMLNVLTGEASPPVVPIDAYNLDSNQARESVRKLAALEPAVCWPGHVGPATGDVREQLERAAA